MKYRAAYYLAHNGCSTVLTGPEHSGMSDDALRAEALAEAIRGDVIDLEASSEEEASPRITRAMFEAGLRVGDWSE